MNTKQRENAYIPREKLTDYLLSQTHPVGASKAQFFRGLGYNERNLDVLERDLLEIVQTQPVLDVISSQHGVKYVVEGILSLGTHARIITVWIIEEEQDAPRFVTAYPS